MTLRTTELEDAELILKKKIVTQKSDYHDSSSRVSIGLAVVCKR